MESLASLSARCRAGQRSRPCRARPAVAQAGRRFKSTAVSLQGQATLESWGYGREELLAVEESLQRLGHAYDEEEE